LDAEFTRLGYASNVTNYGSGANVVATKGDAKKFVIVSAHYDTPAGVPGADDDASGVAAMLVVAQALAKCSFVRQLRFVAFDEEELGSIGSTAYVEALRHNGELSNLVGVLNLEMLGYDTNSDGGFLLVDCENTTGDHSANTSLVASVDQVIKDLALDLDYQKVCTTGADHDPFWQAARAAITISEEFFFSGADENTCYHQSCDRVGLLNAAYMEKMTTLATGVAVQLAGVP
jgi:Zn-dependent M28 family amino/carboxypeptidase